MDALTIRASGGEGESHSAETATMRSRREMLIGGAMVLAAGIGVAMEPRRRIVAMASGDIGAALPQRAGRWSVAPSNDLVMPPQDEGDASAVYDEQVARTYVDGTSAVMFVLAYARLQTGLLMVHRPEACYPGSGFTITSDHQAIIPLAPGLAPGGRFLSTVRGDRFEQVLYWTRLGNSFPQSWSQERREIAYQNLRGISPDGALVRVSTISTDPQAAKALLAGFAATLFAASPAAGRALLAGPANARPLRPSNPT